VKRCICLFINVDDQGRESNQVRDDEMIASHVSILLTGSSFNYVVNGIRTMSLEIPSDSVASE
jgi:hypothetical protein